MSGTSSTVRDAGSDSGVSSISGGSLSGIGRLFGFGPTTANTTAAPVETVSPRDVKVEPVQELAAAEAGASGNDEEDVFKDVEDDGPGTEDVKTQNDGYEEDEGEGIDPGFSEKADLHPLFGIGTEHDYSDMLVFRPVYNLDTFAGACDHATLITDESVQITHAITHARILTLANDRYDSGRDLANLAYAMVFRDYVPWDYTTAVNMAVRQMRINDDASLQRVSGAATPFRMVYDIALGHKRARCVVEVPIDSFIKNDCARIDVDAAAELMEKLTDATAFYVGTGVYEAFIPDIEHLSKRVGKTMLYQPAYAFMVHQQLAQYGSVVECNDYKSHIDSVLKSHSLLGILGDEAQGLAPGPEDIKALKSAKDDIKKAIKDEDVASMVVKLMRMSNTCANPINAPAKVSANAARASVAPTETGMLANEQFQYGKRIITRSDLAALVHAIKQGPAEKDTSLKDFGYFDSRLKSEDMRQVFGTFLNGKGQIPNKVRSKIAVLFGTEKDPIRQAVRLAGIIATTDIDDHSRMAPKPGAAAVIHMVRTWPQSACQEAHNMGMDLSFDWVFA